MLINKEGLLDGVYCDKCGRPISTDKVEVEENGDFVEIDRKRIYFDLSVDVMDEHKHIRDHHEKEFCSLNCMVNWLNNNYELIHYGDEWSFVKGTV